MAFKIGKRALKFKSLVKSELLWREIPMKHDYSYRINKYKESLKDLTNTDNKEFGSFLYFPLNTFNKYPLYVVNNLIQDSLEVFQQKNIMNNIDAYNCILKSYIENHLNFEVKNLLQEMNGKKIKLNEETYTLLIEYYSRHGQMANVEALFKAMQSANVRINPSTNLQIITGYIISGQPEKSKVFITDNNMNENSVEVLLSEANGYASLGDIEKVMEIINHMKEENLHPNPSTYFTFYQKLAKANVPESDLEQVLNRVIDPSSTDIYSTVIKLNRDGLFNCSLHLVERFQDKLTNINIASNLVTSFNSKDCPLSKYKRALELLINNIHSEKHKHIFSNISFKEAMKFSRGVSNDINGRVIIPSLLNRAIQEKSVDFITEALRFGRDNFKWMHLNLFLITDFLPAMLHSGMASNCQQILSLLPEFRRFLTPVALLYCLCNANFSEFNDLKATESFDVLIVRSRPLAVEVVRRLSWPDIVQLATEAGTVFPRSLVNNLLANIITEQILQSSASGNTDAIAEAVKLAEDFNVAFTTTKMDTLFKAAGHHKELFQSLSSRIIDSPMKHEDPSKGLDKGMYKPEAV